MRISLVTGIKSQQTLSALILAALVAGCSSTGNQIAWPWKSNNSTTASVPTYQPLPTANTAPITTASIQPQSFAQNTSNSIRVGEGDTLYGIARRAGITTSSLMQANGITSASQLKVGQYLVIPRFSTPAAQSTIITQPMPSAPVAVTPVPMQQALYSSMPPQQITQPMPAAPVTTASVPKQAPQQHLYTGSIASTAGHYRVQTGDTLYSISRRTGVPVNQIMAQNGISDASSLKIGSNLVLPTGVKTQSFASNTQNVNIDPITTASITPKTTPSYGSSYKVVKGDTLYGIGRKTNIHPKAIMAKNGFSSSTTLKPGQYIKLPAKAEEAALVKKYAPTPVAVKPTTSTQSSLISTPPKTFTPIKTAAKPTVVTPSTAPVASGFNWPVKGRVISGFGSKTDGSFNNGIDISVPENTEVRAADNGVVAFVGDTLKGYGNLILLRHNDGWVSAYAHNSKILVQRGQTVTRGQPIALSGKTGAAETPRLHFELRKQSKAVDPIGELPRI